MSEDKSLLRTARQKRVQRLKKYIVTFLLVSTWVPIVLCIILAVQFSGLQQDMKILQNRMQDMSEILQRREEDISELKGLMDSRLSTVQTGNGEAEAAETDFERTGQLVVDERAQTPPAEDLGRHKVYLTFDDGPSCYTDEILTILDRYQIKATFFVVGKESQADKEALQKIVEGGHSLGMHSYSHKYAEVYADKEAFVKDFEKLRNYLKEVTGVDSRLYRFPGGSSNLVSRVDMSELITFLEEEEVTYFDWNVSSGDAGSKQLTVEQLVKNATQSIAEYDTSVILLHDAADKRTTVEALPIIIENILALEDTAFLPITEDTEPVQHSR